MTTAWRPRRGRRAAAHMMRHCRLCRRRRLNRRRNMGMRGLQRLRTGWGYRIDLHLIRLHWILSLFRRTWSRSDRIGVHRGLALIWRDVRGRWHVCQGRGSPLREPGSNSCCEAGCEANWCRNCAHSYSRDNRTCCVCCTIYAHPPLELPFTNSVTCHSPALPLELGLRPHELLAGNRKACLTERVAMKDVHAHAGRMSNLLTFATTIGIIAREATPMALNPPDARFGQVSLDILLHNCAGRRNNLLLRRR